MSVGSTIEWTEATWNPVVGCQYVSEGCRNCYAASMTRRLEAMGRPQYAGLVGPKHFNGTVRTVPEALELPLRWRKPRRVFVNSMSDLFHPDVPFDFVDQVFAVMALCPQHIFQILTKRPERMAEYMTGFVSNIHTRSHRVYLELGRLLARKTVTGPTTKGWPPPNVWLMTSCENQPTLEERVPRLLKCLAAVRGLSLEPLLGPIDCSHWVFNRRRVIRKLMYGPAALNEDQADSHVAHTVDWVIVGGESGPGARPMHPDWVRSIRDQCVAAGVPFFFKQWGEWAPHTLDSPLMNISGREPMVDLAGDTIMRRVGKKKAGRVLDGRTWDEFPEMRLEAVGGRPE